MPDATHNAGAPSPGSGGGREEDVRAVVQRVSRATVVVDERVVGQVDTGFLVLVGVTHSDGRREAEWMARKIAGLRVFDDDAGKMNRSLPDIGGSVLVVSQFTLYGDARQGRRPSFTAGARPEQAEPLVDYLVERLRAEDIPVATGEFGAMMAVTLVNDGPVTLWLDTADTAA
jgi:D-aminoacyl-tRNA deacylase